jgi:hypothetical protein
MTKIWIASAALVVSLWAGGGLQAQPATGSTKPHLGNGPAVEKSLPSSAPAATTTAKTGATNQDKTVKTMNNNEKSKVEVEGK